MLRYCLQSPGLTNRTAAYVVTLLTQLSNLQRFSVRTSKHASVRADQSTTAFSHQLDHSLTHSETKRMVQMCDDNGTADISSTFKVLKAAFQVLWSMCQRGNCSTALCTVASYKDSTSTLQGTPVTCTRVQHCPATCKTICASNEYDTTNIVCKNM